MQSYIKLLLIFFILFEIFLPGAADAQSKKNIEVWLTNPKEGILFKKQEKTLAFETNNSKFDNISIQPDEKYQVMEGFGNCLTGGSAMLIYKMEKGARENLLQELFKTNDYNIGISYLRVSIGASDLDEKVFSYNDLSAGETDPQLLKFDLDYDTLYLIPLLKEILAINPEIKILGSPWSAPVWMKTNGDTRGGSLKPEWFSVYSQYFVKYIQAMKAEGINIDAITIQNEPLHPGNNPSMYMTAADQAIFIKKYLGPEFVSNNIKTKIIIYDHNADRPDYPLEILGDPEAEKYIDGSAFHLYAGKIETLSDVHKAYPDKHLYFTEQWVGAPGDFSKELQGHIKTLIIGGSRNWCRNVLEWNMAADPNQDPHTDRGGCDRCLGAVTIDGNKVSRNPSYYILAHTSKFVRPGSVRIGSGLVSSLPNVAFLTPSGKIALIVLNDTHEMKNFNIVCKGKKAGTTLAAGAVATYIW